MSMDVIGCSEQSQVPCYTTASPRLLCMPFRAGRTGQKAFLWVVRMKWYGGCPYHTTTNSATPADSDVQMPLTLRPGDCEEIAYAPNWRAG